MLPPGRYASRSENGTEHGVLESTRRRRGGDALHPLHHEIRIIRTKPLQPARNKESGGQAAGAIRIVRISAQKSRRPEFVDRSVNEL
jgi:hypothetical protein